MARALSVWLPRLPLDRLVRDEDPRLAGAFAVTSDAGNSVRLVNLNDIARGAGLTPDMSLADAHAICPDLLTAPSNPILEASLLRALARWADRFSPRVALDGEDGLLLDITGCAHLFGGEESMAGEVRGRLADMQIAARIGVADAGTAARALSRFGRGPVAIAPAGDGGDAIRSLPVAALDVPRRLADDLERAGIRTLGPLFDIRTGELARRFGLDIVRSLGAARGREPDPTPPAVADPVFSASMSLPEPIGRLEDLETVLRRLAGHLCGRLEEAHMGARRFLLTVRCTDTGDHPLSVGFAKPCLAVEAVLRQFAPPLGKLGIGYGADWLRLEARETEPVEWRQTRLGETVEDDEDKLAGALATIGNRLGFDRLLRHAPRESRLPEREFDLVPAESRGADTVWEPTPRRRPLRLFRPPERLRIGRRESPPKRFAWRGTAYRVISAEGPERLTSEWWRDEDAPVRDYWIVRTDKGLRLWLLNHPGERGSPWFVAGRFP